MFQKSQMPGGLPGGGNGRFWNWPVHKYPIEFEILLFTTVKAAIHGIAPDYICKLISLKSSTSYPLRSNQRIMLAIPSARILSTLGGKAFCYAAPKLWKNLPSKYLAWTHCQVLSATSKHISLNKLLICKSYIFYFVKYYLFFL